jgi:hypothetical protein
MMMQAKQIERRTAITLAAGLLAMVMVESAAAVPFIESAYGGQSPWYSAELNAVANTGAAVGRGGLSNILNPAGLAWTTGTQLDLGLTIVRHEEDRFMPVYDSFGSWVIDMAIASNQKTRLSGSAGLALRNPSLPVVVGLSLVERYPFQYAFEEEIRNPYPYSSPERDRILEERRYEVEGALRTLSCGLAGQLLGERLAVGAAVHYTFGDRNEYVFVRNYTDGESFDLREEWDLNGFHATIGVQSRIHERLALGAAYETRLKVDGEINDDPGQYALRYPGNWRGGLAFFPRSDPRTVFTADIVYTDWTALEDNRYDAEELPLLQASLQEVIDVCFGVEHTFYNQARLRFGFRRYDSYADREGGNSVFSAGAGWPLASGMMAFSLELNKVQSVLPHIFGYFNEDGSQYYAADTARVDDRRIRLGFSWSRNF